MNKGSFNSFIAPITFTMINENSKCPKQQKKTQGGMVDKQRLCVTIANHPNNLNPISMSAKHKTKN